MRYTLRLALLLVCLALQAGCTGILWHQSAARELTVSQVHGVVRDRDGRPTALTIAYSDETGHLRKTIDIPLDASGEPVAPYWFEIADRSRYPSDDDVPPEQQKAVLAASPTTRMEYLTRQQRGFQWATAPRGVKEFDTPGDWDRPKEKGPPAVRVLLYRLRPASPTTRPLASTARSGFFHASASIMPSRNDPAPDGAVGLVVPARIPIPDAERRRRQALAAVATPFYAAWDLLWVPPVVVLCAVTGQWP